MAQSERSAAGHLQMVHDEHVRVARKLIATGLPAETDVLLADAQRYFPDREELQRDDSFPLEVLAQQKLVSEGKS